LYFSDPWTTSPNNPVGGVYGRNPGTDEVHRIDHGLCFPNGVVTRDDALLVAETHRLVVWAYELLGGGRATGKRRFCDLPDVADAPRLPPEAQAELGLDHLCGPDGMAFDAEGNLYVAHFASGAVFVFDTAGAEIDRIAVPGRAPTNVCFAGDALDQLVATLDDTGEVVLADIGMTGRRLPFCPSLAGDHPWAAAMPPLPPTVAPSPI
jgi:gluconolactonase